MKPTIGVPKERLPGERRVAAVPEVVTRYITQGLDVRVERGAGETAGFTDAAYEAAGACLTDTADAFAASVVLKVAPPSRAETELFESGALLVGMLSPFGNAECFERLAQSGVNALAMELLPRISRAQALDVLSSQANIAGYRAVIEAAGRYPGLMPLMMTAAGTAKPARVVVLGVGVAGLQAIATAKRLGAQVEAFDVRPETRDQVLSLGAKFIDLDLGEQAAGGGGYAGQLSAQAAARQQQLL
ncbi:MAG: NAD(P)(+) transhydrogenase (Re/Si-specific) subunit alpha, partial [Pseudomonadota bacterium]|nr:NAD(P)(+) transhydrogenase (Re/Si-specific) subunit alpha [Pseudomonadota bacterium]